MEELTNTDLYNITMALNYARYVAEQDGAPQSAAIYDALFDKVTEIHRARLSNA